MDAAHAWLFAAAAFCIGACIGSFLNVCAYRIPLGRSVVTPGSHCAACGAPIPGRHNIPIVSWLLLRGRAACCGTRIDFRYCLVEFFTALVFLGLWLRFAPLEAFLYAVMTAGLIVACLIDLDHFIIPDRFSLGGCAAGFAACLADPHLMGETAPMRALSWSMTGAVIGGLLIVAVSWLGRLILKKEAMGLGDAKLLAALGAFLGPMALSWIVPVSSLLGSVVGIGLIVSRRSGWGARIPYGPFIGLAAILWFFGGAELTHAWWSNMTPAWELLWNHNADLPGPR